jgi:hypothetical protein
VLAHPLNNLAQASSLSHPEERHSIFSKGVVVVRAHGSLVVLVPLRADVGGRHRVEILVIHPLERRAIGNDPI